MMASQAAAGDDAQASGAAPPRLSLFLWNTRGLGGDRGQKLARLLLWAINSEHHVLVLTETHLTVDPMEWLSRQPGAPGSLRWKGSYFWAPGTNHSRGVLVLFKDTPLVCNLPPSCRQDDLGIPEAAGRVVRVDFTHHGEPFTLVGVYAPNTGAARSAFFGTALAPFLPQGRRILVGGDFNCVELAADRTDGTSRPASSRHDGVNALCAVALAYNLQDVWRQAAGPHTVDFTHWSGSGNSGARLDRWLISGDLVGAEATWDPVSNILAASPETSDHLPVSLTLRAPAPPCRGQRPWRLALQLLGDEQFAEELSALVRHHRASCVPGQAVRRWKECKDAIARVCQAKSKALRHERRAVLRAATKAAASARAQVLASAGTGADPADSVAVWRAAAAAVTQVHRAAAAKALTAYSVLDHLYGDSSTYWFHLRGKAPVTPTVLTRLKPTADASPDETADLTTVPGTQRALGIAVAYFSGDSPTGVFRPKEGTDVHTRAVVLSRLHKRLTPGQAAAAERPLCLPGPVDTLVAKEEMLGALKRCARGKAPGLDGLPYEFYVALWEEVGPFLVQVFNEAFLSPDPAPLEPLLEGLICPVHKPGRSTDLLAGYRPITLLGADIKLLAKTVADRLHLPLDYIVSSLQSAFIEGRDIAENVLYHLRLAEYLRDSEHPAWLLITDLAGAYDNVDRQFLLDCLTAYGFKVDGHVRWAALLHRGTKGRVLVNDHVSWPFPILSGLAQGSPISTVYWTVVAEPLIQRLQSLAAQGRIRTPAIEGIPFLGPHAFADDIKQPVCDPTTDGSVLVDACREFHAASGVPLNVDKCQAVPLSAPSREAQPLEPQEPPSRVPGVGFLIPPASKPPKLLGMPYTADYELAKRLAFERRVGGMVAATSVWSQTKLNFVGRAHVAKQCVASVTMYHAAFLRPDPALERKMQGICRGFAARSNIPGDAAPTRGRHAGMQPRELAAALPWKLGGANLVYLPSMFPALAAKNVVRVFGPHRHRMKPLMLRAFAAADDVTASATWVITMPHAPRLLEALTPRLQDYVRGLAEARAHRLVAPDTQGFYSALAEPLAFNRQIRDPAAEAPACFSPAVLDTPTGRGWRYLRDLRRAVLQGDALGSDVRADLDRVLPLLPAPWRAHVTCPDPPPAPSWSCAQLADGTELVCRGAGPTDDPAGLFVVLDMGRMELAGDAALPPVPALTQLPWSPCLVVPIPKPARHWTPADYLAVQQAKENKTEHTPEDLWLMGGWDTLLLDPTVWGFGDTPLHLFEVKTARLRCLLLKAAAQLAPRFSPDAGLRPVAWPADDPPASATAAQAPPRSNRDVASRLRERLRHGAPEIAPAAPVADAETGLVAHERPWLEAFELKRADEQGDRPPGERDSAMAPSWMLPSPPRGSGCVGRRRPREEDGLHAAPSQQGDAGAWDDTTDALAKSLGPPASFAAAWSRLCSRHLNRLHRTTAWRIMHGALLVNGLRHYLDDRLPSSAALCSHPACMHAQVVETISHAVFQCPAVLPALHWLQSFWEALTAERPPLDARVILADDHRVWAPKEAAALWTLVRTAMLHEIWHCRSSRPELAGSLGSAVVARVIQHLQTAIERDWARVGQNVAQMSELPEDYFRGRKTEFQLSDFLDMWAHNDILCSVEDHALVLRLNLQHPVPVPVA